MELEVQRFGRGIEFQMRLYWRFYRTIVADDPRIFSYNSAIESPIQSRI
jgi:hypothetical protein